MARARGRVAVRALVAAVVACGLTLTAGVGAEDRLDWRKVRVVKPDDSASVANCEYRGEVRDDSMKDLLKKATEIDADTVRMRAGVVYKDYLFAEAYRCGGRR